MMTSRDVFWDEGPEYEKPEDIESRVERMRRLNEAFKEDYSRLFQCLFGRDLPEIKQ
jgi:hypothetical protein